MMPPPISSPAYRCPCLPAGVLSTVLIVVMAILPHLAGAESLSVGSGTSPDDAEAAASAAVVEQIRRLADESRRGAPQFSMTGVVSRRGDLWEVNGEPFRISGDTVMSGDITPGGTVEVRGLLEATRPLTAREVRVFPTLPAASVTPARSRMAPADARMLR